MHSHESREGVEARHTACATDHVRPPRATGSPPLRASARQRLARPGGRRVTSTGASWQAVDHHVPRAAGRLAAPRRMLHNARAHRARRRGGPRAVRRAAPPPALADGDDMVPDARIPSRGWAPAIVSLLARGPRDAAFPLACRTPLAGGVRAHHGQEGYTGSIGHGFRPPVISSKQRAIARALSRTSAVHAAVREASCAAIPSCGAAVSASRHCRVVFVTPPTAPRFRTARADLLSCVEPLDP